MVSQLVSGFSIFQNDTNMKTSWLAGLIFLSMLPIGAAAQDKGIDDFSKNESICYCMPNWSTPNDVVGFDNNWQLLRAMQVPRSKEELDSLGIPCTYSQLQLLRDWGLIERNEDDRYQTAILLLDSTATGRLRAHSRRLSDELVGVIRPSVTDYVRLLERDGLGGHAYSLLFSLVTDGLTWKRLEADGRVRKMELTLKHPMWDGEFWTLYPKRDFYCGTNKSTLGEFSISLNWSEKAFQKMIPLFKNSYLVPRMFDDLSKSDRVSDAEVIAGLSPFGLVDGEGRPTVPVIREDTTDVIYAASWKMAGTIADFLASHMDTVALRKEFGFVDGSQSIVILYHEMLWDVLAQLEQAGLVKRPAVLADPEHARPEEFGKVIFLTRSEAEK